MTDYKKGLEDAINDARLRREAAEARAEKAKEESGPDLDMSTIEATYYPDTDTIVVNVFSEASGSFEVTPLESKALRELLGSLDTTGGETTKTWEGEGRKAKPA